MALLKLKELIDKDDIKFYPVTSSLAVLRPNGKTAEESFNNLELPEGIVIDKFYVHTDNNFTSVLKDKLLSAKTGYVFNTVAELDARLADPTFTVNLRVGDDLYIKALDVPDYWWDGIQKQILETAKVNLDDYAKKTDLNNYVTLNTSQSISGGKTFTSTLTTTGVLYANRYSTNSNAPALVINQPGNNWLGIGPVTGNNQYMRYGLCTTTSWLSADSTFVHDFDGTVKSNSAKINGWSITKDSSNNLNFEYIG